MRGGRQILLVTLLLGAATLGMARTPDGPPEYTPVVDSECWTCHKPGAYDPDMDPYVALSLDPLTVGVGEQFRLPAQIMNAWIAPKGGFELYDFRVTLDISNATSLGFVSDREPETAGPFLGAIPIDPTAIVDPNYLTAPQRGNVVVPIPAGATTVVITVTPDNVDPTTGPDLAVNIFSGSDASGSPVRTVNAAAAGGVERFKANTPSDFGEIGFGNWTIQAETTLLNPNGPTITPTAGDIGFSVRLDAWFNASAEVQQVVSSDDLILPEQRTLLGWDLELRHTPVEGESMRFLINMTSYYPHEGNTDPDYWDFSEPFDFPITITEDGGAAFAQEGGPILVPKGPQLSLARIGEVIGYISAILLIASVWTGGMFGKKSRRQLNSIFGSARRRVAFHNFLSYGIIAFALAHMFLFMWDVNGQLTDGFHWLLGVLWGGLGILALLALGVTGAIQVPMIRKWNYAVWRWSHFGLAIAAIVFTLIHMFLDGQNFGFIQEWLNYSDPLVPEGRG